MDIFLLLIAGDLHHLNCYCAMGLDITKMLIDNDLAVYIKLEFCNYNTIVLKTNSITHVNWPFLLHVLYII